MSDETPTPAAADPGFSDAEVPRVEGEAVAFGAAVALRAEAPAGAPAQRNLDLLLDVSVPITVQLGGAEMQIRDVLDLAPGSIVALDKLAGEPVDVFVRGRLLARGEVVVVDDNFGIRITHIVNPDTRVNSLR